MGGMHTAVLVGAAIALAGALIAGLFSSKRVLSPGGGVVSFDSVTVTGAEVPRLPAASRATAVMVCEPSPTWVVSHETE